jgi:hypothetical protein
MHFDPAAKLLSDQFVYQLLVHQDDSQSSLRKLYFRWPDNLKIKQVIMYTVIPPRS